MGATENSVASRSAGRYRHSEVNIHQANLPHMNMPNQRFFRQQEPSLVPLFLLPRSVQQQGRSCGHTSETCFPFTGLVCLPAAIIWARVLASFGGSYNNPTSFLTSTLVLSGHWLTPPAAGRAQRQSTGLACTEILSLGPATAKAGRVL